MERKYPNLYSPLKIGGITMKNRIISAPMTYPILTSDGCLTPEAAAFYELRAKGGAAVVTVSELIVDGKMGKYYPIQVTIDAPNAKDSLAIAARAVRRHGAIASMELSHGGQFALTEGPAWGPVDVYENDKLIARQMTKAVIDDLLESYARAAALCRDAGFEMLLIHSGHGWLLEQFLSPSTNKREDQYGGSLQNRARLALEVIDAVRSSVGPGFPLELRISAEEYLEDGYTFSDTIEYAKLVESKIDLLQVSTGSHHGSFDKTHPSMFYERGVNVHYAEEMKKHVKIPVSTIGALNEPQMLEDIIASGRADAVVMGRALLADPYLPRKAFEGRDNEIVRCCRCFTCMAERLVTGLRICALNPVIGHEYEHNYSPAPAQKKSVLIAGGGPAGMQCALTAAERGHDVVLCEKSDSLGGALKSERGISFKEDLFKFIAVKRLQLENAGVDIKLGTEVTPGLVKEMSPDALIIAIGSDPLIPPVIGIENAVMADDITSVGDSIGKRVVIIGGGLVGCETGVHLAREGHDVTVVEMKSTICADANPRHRPLLLAEMEKQVKCLVNTRAISIDADGLTCQKDDSEHFLPADTIICAAGRVPKADVAAELADCAPYVDMIGDCVKPANVTQAIFRGHFAALDI
ncbi:MAG: FAD-dependent oxidoreductase [Oscillospiraceae bacterium]|nr:FAD-dependent oxidoreductase [Oscillospiraceae bacterium]